MAQAGHEVFAPTLTGLGERAHLLNREIDLDTHITDVLNVLELEDLHDVVLIGHSYGGMVATGVADRAAGRLSQLVYLDAFVPRDGQSLLDLLPPDTASRMREVVKTTGDGWRVPPNPMPPDTPEADLAWAMPRRVMQPVKTFEERLRLTGAVEGLPRTYIYCTKTPPGDVFGQFARRAKSERGWRHFEIDSSHNPHITIPESFAALLDKIVGGR